MTPTLTEQLKTRFKRRARLLVMTFFAVAMLGIVAAWRWTAWFDGAPHQPSIVVSGNIEAHESVLSVSQVQAPIVYLPFDEGARVTRGTVLAKLDDSLYRRQAEIDRGTQEVDQAQIQVYQSNLAAARHSVDSDRYDLSEKRRDFARAETLVQSNAISVQARDLAYTAQQQSAAALAHDQALALAARDNISLAQADLSAAQAKVKLDEVMLAYTVLTAPFDGVIAVRQAELGELAGPGVAVFTLDELDHVWLRAYVNESDLGNVRLNQPVDVNTDSYPGKTYRGRISFISPQAEFTPKTVETHAERVNLVYRIRIDIDNPTHELLPGMPADATIHRVAAGQ